MILSTIVEISSPYFNGNYEVQGTSKKRMIYLGDQLVATVEDNAGTITPHYTHTDHLNGASIITNTSGTQDELIDYYAFGEQRVDSYTTFKEKRKFTGHLHDDDTGLEYVKARYLNSGYNRFISQDGIFQAVGDEDKIMELGGKDLNVFLRDPQSLNSYSYARNNPYKYNDPTGNVIETAVDIASVAFDVHSLRQSIRDGNIKGAAGNSAMLMLDLGATAIPGIPAVGSVRAFGKAVEGIKDAEKGVQAGLDVKKSAEATKTIEKVHGNSLQSTKINTGYTLRDRSTGEILKFGETTKTIPSQRYSSSFFETTNTFLKPELQGSKIDIHKWQHEQILDYKFKNGGKRPTLNKSDW